MRLNRNPGLVVLCFRAMQAVAGFATLLLAIVFLTRHEWGVYQTMVNLASVSNVFEAGLSGVLVQLVASWTNSNHAMQGVGRPAPNLGPDLGADATGLIKTAVWWCGAGGLVFLLFIPLGWYFIFSGSDVPVLWQLSWLVLVVVSAVQLPVTAVMSGLEGSGKLASVYTIRLAGTLLGGLCTWWAMAIGWKYWAAVMMPLCVLLVQVVALARTYPAYVGAIWRSAGVAQQRWLAQIWPLQWRSAMGWVAGYAHLFVHVPVIYHVSGAVDAGRLASTVTVVNTVSVISLAWPLARVPELVRHAANRQRALLDALFVRVMVTSVSLYTIGAAVVFLLFVYLQKTPWSERFLSLHEIALLMVALCFYTVSMVLTMYVKAHLQDPVYKLAMLSAGLTVLLSIALSWKFGAMGVVVSLLFVNVFVYFPWSLKYYRNYRHPNPETRAV